MQMCWSEQSCLVNTHFLFLGGKMRGGKNQSKIRGYNSHFKADIFFKSINCLNDFLEFIVWIFTVIEIEILLRAS